MMIRTPYFLVKPINIFLYFFKYNSEVFGTWTIYPKNKKYTKAQVESQ
jgi:hypothetical protein